MRVRNRKRTLVACGISPIFADFRHLKFSGEKFREGIEISPQLPRERLSSQSSFRWKLMNVRFNDCPGRSSLGLAGETNYPENPARALAQSL